MMKFLKDQGEPALGHARSFLGDDSIVLFDCDVYGFEPNPEGHRKLNKTADALRGGSGALRYRSLNYCPTLDFARWPLTEFQLVGATQVEAMVLAWQLRHRTRRVKNTIKTRQPRLAVFSGF